MKGQDEKAVDAMKDGVVVRPVNSVYRRDSAFSYACHACSRCCHDKVIRLNPYEVDRLAMNRGITTTEFLSRYTESNGTSLRRVEEGACVFLSRQGCGVHEDRPLVCRLYPLGRRVTAEGEETFHELTPHPRTEGEYGRGGTVQDFLTTQGAQPFIEAVDRYVELVGSMAVKLHSVAANDHDLLAEVKQATEGVDQRHDAILRDWTDMDSVLTQYCLERGMTVPDDVTERMPLHIRAVTERLDKL
ncbi:conserved protein of unknown function [Nitrospira japonica]|uniref:YkgJ family cysteine cluster protein n=1 Tax=Nitrospira japonica TaxID=1325564 RepID=A0A1W1I0K7_9BACT|nr:conserved protein of unknown function [Nitrospira japonica]